MGILSMVELTFHALIRNGDTRARVFHNFCSIIACTLVGHLVG